MAASNSLDILAVVSPESLAYEISVHWTKWKNARIPWENEVEETRNFLYATDTSTTSAGTNPFKNSTTTPKLAQIAQNLKANYMSHAFSNPNWINWEAHNRDASLEQKRRAVESYIRTKARQQNVVDTFGALLDDWIQTGNCFAGIEYVNEEHVDDLGNPITGYRGPRMYRISPNDVVMNITATNWKRAPKIIRTLKSLGDLAREVQEKPELGYTEELLAKIQNNRHVVKNAQQISTADIKQSNALIADGFGSIQEYYNSDLVEVLEFHGDLYDQESGQLLKDHVITVVDRAFVVRKEPMKSWTGSSYLYHHAWRKRPDNLMGIGPLASLVGMQYKIDKLENLRADVFDQIANPTVVETGNVEFFGTRGAPGQRYVVEEGGNVSFLRPDATALNADLQIQQTMNLMEELAGSPREAMGLRSPGEKTKFEVQTLDNAANRIFREKIFSFEREFINEILNDMLEMARRNIDGVDIVQAEDNVFGAAEFLEVTREDITAIGKLYASGSSHFERQAQAVQNLNTIFNSNMGQMVNPHVSRLKLAKTLEDLLGMESDMLVQENVGILEDIKSQQLAQQGQQQLEEESLTSATLEDEEEDEV